MLKPKKESISVNACIGNDLFELLEAHCRKTGQSKTVAVERAIREYCRMYDGIDIKSESDSEKQ